MNPIDYGPTHVPELDPCWRCGKVADPPTDVCPFCQARLRPASAESRHLVAAEPGMHPLLKVITAYSVMLLISLVWGIIIHFGGRPDQDEHLAGTSTLEALDTLIVIVTALAIGRLCVPKPAASVRFAAWLVAPFALVFVLLVNVSYRWALTEFLRAGWLKDALAEPEWSALTVLLMAVQPALIEEWFFRHLALGAMRTVGGIHAAVWVSAVMFAMAHVYNPLGLPWLLVAGVVFGYARVASGGLAIPILMHFAHNAIILWFRGFV
jgi:membrane protease YdiL (CAAX protease family)